MNYRYLVKCINEKNDGKVKQEEYTINSNVPLWIDSEEDRNKIRSFLNNKDNNKAVCILGLEYTDYNYTTTVAEDSFAMQLEAIVNNPVL